ncbi:FAD binding domain protein [Penicillium malachiteum]|uniref:FAD binding domain protein n=1 Tax=Penicillium malachiteum TaxID=1324776 RepID=UPI0025472069|nr:FAD binding domain protein [Penicillium malachiteum]KAJ5716008.1 FAD binding domain protein [Penicillium malachiteum]
MLLGRLISLGPLATIAHAVTADSSCRCYPGESCWPSAQQWNAFNETIGGKLIPTVPLGSVCHYDSFTPYNAQECAQLTSVWDYPITHYTTTSSPMAAWFQNFTCDPYLAPSDSCTLGPFQPYAVNVTNAQDVQETLHFTQKHNIRLVIRNTGHDYYGKSTAPGAVALWTHNMKQTEYLDYNSSAYAGPALRIGAGIQGFEAMEAANSYGKAIVTGNCASVGIAGGYSQGGGHGPLASWYGLGVDQVLEWEVVTVSGDVLTVSPTQTPDLFWALTGGGGGTYAIVLSLTVKLHPEVSTAAASLTFEAPDKKEIFWEAVKTFVTDIMPLTDVGAVAIWEVAEYLFELSPITLPGGTRQKLQKQLEPTLSLLKKNNISYSYTIKQFSTYYASYEEMNPGVNITEYQIGGRLIPRSVLESNPASFISTLQSISQEGGVISGVSLNVSQNQAAVTSVNPAWRNAAISVVLGTAFNYTSRTADLNNQKLITDKLVPQLEALSPGGGAYLNEADFNQPDWQYVFYGKNYARLETIKSKYDPDGVLYGLTSVGSDKWVENNDGQLCRKLQN